jgi:pilus assembly protein CpaB
MTRRRRAAALLGLAVLLGILAASDVAGREAAVRRQLGPMVPVVIARTAVRSGDRMGSDALALRHVPARYVPAGAIGDPREVVGRRAAVAIAPGADLDQALLAVPGQEPGATPSGYTLRGGERALDVVAVAAPDAVPPGTRVDVLVTSDARGPGPGATRVALAGAQVLSARPASPAADSDLPRVLATLRVTQAQAIGLTAALAAAREVRLLPRPAG